MDMSPVAKNNKEDLAEQLANESIKIDSFKNERNLMLFPFCSTSKALRRDTIRYVSEDTQFTLEVTANHEYGMAKIWDFDILRFVFSKIDIIEKRTGHYPSKITFSAYECLKALDRNPKAGKNVSWLKGALDRLASTTYKGNIFRDDTRQVVGFTLINYAFKETNNSIKIEIELNERLMDSVRTSQNILKINPLLINESSGLKKRLFELVDLLLNENKEWIVSLSELQNLCANSWGETKFKCEVRSFKDIPWIISELKINGRSHIRFKVK